MMTYIRNYSALGAYQKAHQLVYCCCSEAAGQRLTLSRNGDAAGYSEAVCAKISAPEAEEILLYLYENGITPELWHDVLDDLLPGKYVRL